jgi:hypothetical protein
MGRPRAGQPSPDDGARETVVHMKGSPEYVRWLDQVHKKTHIPKVQIFRIAVRDWAERNGHLLPPDI